MILHNIPKHILITKYRYGGDVSYNSNIDFNKIKTDLAIISPNLNRINVALAKEGYSNLQRAAILASIIGESGGNPLAKNGSAGSGLVQWEPRRYRFKSSDPEWEFNNQLSHLIRTLANDGGNDWTDGGEGTGYRSWKNAKDDFINGTTLDTIIRGLSMGYVRPKDKWGDYRKRLNIANQIYSLLEENDTNNINSANAGNFLVVDNQVRRKNTDGTATQLTAGNDAYYWTQPDGQQVQISYNDVNNRNVVVKRK